MGEEDVGTALMNGLGETLKDITSGNVSPDTFIKAVSGFKKKLPSLAKFKVVSKYFYLIFNSAQFNVRVKNYVY